MPLCRQIENSIQRRIRKPFSKIRRSRGDYKKKIVEWVERWEGNLICTQRLIIADVIRFRARFG